MEKTALIERIKRFSNGKVMVVGDIALDEMIYGVTSRLSREAPVIILHHQRTDILLGAGGNAAHNISALGAKKVTMVGLAGKDYYCSLLFEAMERDGISFDGVVQDEERPTVTKTRISGQARQSVLQQIVRVDRESQEPLSSRSEEKLIERILSLAPGHDAILISDYNLGVVTPRVIGTCKTTALSNNMLLAVDSHRSLALFSGATIATPNQPEAEENLGYSLSGKKALVDGGLRLKEHAGIRNLLITRGSEGMALFEEDGKIHQIPAFNKVEVFDVTGAGDTVIGTLTLGMATGSSILEASILGNLAAGIVVKKYATAVTSQQEMSTTIYNMDESLLNVELYQVTV